MCVITSIDPASASSGVPASTAVITVRPGDAASLCPACAVKRFHTPEEWKNHPFAGHGFTKEAGWSHAGLEPK